MVFTETHAIDRTGAGDERWGGNSPLVGRRAVLGCGR